MKRDMVTRAMAYAAGHDAGNKSMRQAGRVQWNEDDYNRAARVTGDLLVEPLHPQSSETLRQLIKLHGADRLIAEIKRLA